MLLILLTLSVITVAVLAAGGIRRGSFGRVQAGNDAASERPSDIRQAAGPRPSLELREVLRIGSVDGRFDAFGRITDVAIDSRGRLLVADELNHRVAVFDAAGRFVGNAGRQGSGPGELQSPWLVAADGADSVWVYDVGAARMSVYSPGLVFARGFAMPPSWLVTSLRFMPDGRVLVAAFGSGETRGIHLLTRAGARDGSFGPPISEDPRLGGFDDSLLGGTLDLRGDVIRYSVKSPYALRSYGLDGRPGRECRGAAGWTTPPAEVVETTGEGQSLRWNRYVHATRVIALSDSIVLNVVHDPATGRPTLDLVSDGCRLLRRTALDAPLHLRAHRNGRIAAVRMLDYPEVVIYDASLRFPS